MFEGLILLVVLGAVALVLGVSGGWKHLETPIRGPEFAAEEKALGRGDVGPLVARLRDLRSTDPAGADLVLGSLHKELPAAAACALADAQPDDPLHHCVAAQALIGTGWQARGDGWGDTVSQDDWARFHTFLQDAERHLDAAARLGSQDTTGDFVRLMVHRGLDHPPEVTLATLERIRRRRPLHYAAHRDALVNLSWKWGGDNRTMRQHAERWAAQAPAGHPMGALLIPVIGEELLKANQDGDAGAVSWLVERLQRQAKLLPPPDARPSDRAWPAVALDLAWAWGFAGHDADSKAAARLAKQLAAHFT